MATKHLVPPPAASRGMGVLIDRYPARVAWGALLCSFVLFVGLLGVATRAGVSFLRSSTHPAAATLLLRNGSGTVLVQRARTTGWVKAQDATSLSEGDEVQNLGQDFPATLRFFDGTTVSLEPGSSLFLDRVRTARFRVPGSLDRLLDLRLETGTIQISVPADGASPSGVSVRAMSTRVELDPGEFGVELLSRPVDGVEQCCMTQVVSRRGLARVVSAGQTTPVAPGQRALTPMGGLTLPVSAATRELLKNGSLLPDSAGGFKDWTVEATSEPGGPIGQVTPLSPSDGSGIRIDRGATNVHGETGIRQDLNVDVRDLTSLNLAFHYRLRGQSLPGGGRDGSEYPLVVRVTYQESSGGQIPWFHGFYLVPPDANTRTTVQAQGIVPQDTWQVYEGRLLELAPRPLVIRSIELLGSGWSYDVDVAQISLTGT